MSVVTTNEKMFHSDENTSDGDLDPVLSRHTLVPLKVAYKKLRLLIDLGCIFIGHGLAKDFRIISMRSSLRFF